MAPPHQLPTSLLPCVQLCCGLEACSGVTLAGGRYTNSQSPVGDLVGPDCIFSVLSFSHLRDSKGRLAPLALQE